MDGRRWELQLKGAEAQEKAALANEERQRKAEEYSIKMQRDAEMFEQQKLTEQQKAVAEAERITYERDKVAKQSMHEDIVRSKEPWVYPIAGVSCIDESAGSRGCGTDADQCAADSARQASSAASAAGAR